MRDGMIETTESEVAGRHARVFGLLLLISVFAVPRAQPVMGDEERKVTTVAELVAAASDVAVVHRVVAASLAGLPTFRLSPGQTLRGGGSNVTLRFAAGQEGVQLSTDNQVADLERQGFLILRPEEAIERIREYVQTNVVSRLYGWTAPPGLLAEWSDEHLELMAKEVMPAFR